MKRAVYNRPLYIELGLVVLMAIVSLVWLTNVVFAQPAIDPLELLISTKTAYSHVNGYTAKFIRSDGAHPETIDFKFKRPFQVYMKWIENPHRGREVIYVEGQNDDQVIANPGGLLGKLLRLVRISPEQTRGEGGRYTIKDIGIGNMINRLIDHTMLAKANNDLELYYRGEKEFAGRRVHVIERILPPKADYLAHRLVIYIDEELDLPIAIYSYDWNDKLRDHYIYENLKLNAPLNEQDFDPSNPKYGFRYL